VYRFVGGIGKSHFLHPAYIFGVMFWREGYYVLFLKKSVIVYKQRQAPSVVAPLNNDTENKLENFFIFLFGFG
jgi:hypothetical protein